MAQKAEVKYDPAYIMPTQIASHITELGYPATLLEGETVGHNTVEVQVTIVAILCSVLINLSLVSRVVLAQIYGIELGVWCTSTRHCRMQIDSGPSLHTLTSSPMLHYTLYRVLLCKVV